MNELAAALLTRAIDRLAAAVEEYVELGKRDLVGNQVLDAPWDKTSGFPPRALYLFRRMGLKTLADVCELTGREMRNQKNIGRKTVQQIEAVLSTHGLKLRG